MGLFWFIAGVLVGVAASFVAIPLWRGTESLRGKLTLARVPNRYALAGGFLAIFAGAAAIIYLAVGSHHALSSRPALPAMTASSASGGDANAKSMDAEVNGLEARLARDGGSAADWDLLARAYDFLGRPDDARRARAHMPSPGASSVNKMSAGALVAAARATEGGPPSAQSAPSPAAAPPVSQVELERRVKENPRDAQSWLALADVHRTQHDYARARDELAKVIALKAMTAQSWADYADVLASLAGGSLNGAPGGAIDNALALDPANVKALWLKASQAHEQHHYADALKWWTKLRAALPPDSPDARIIEGNIAEDASLAGLPAVATPAMSTAAAPGAASGAEVSGTVSIDRRLAGRVQPDATLFIYAKAADSPGPPLAVVRTTAATWPVSFHLDDSMAMIPSRRLSQFDKVVIEARISRSGQATPSAGDLYVTSPVLHPSEGKKLALVIDREIG
jgi:cytochrome c-type biogenesis protein CcmH